MSKHARVYRFHDLVALNLPGDGSTVYVNAREAIELGKAIERAGLDIAGGTPFTLSKLPEKTIEIASNVRNRS